MSRLCICALIAVAVVRGCSYVEVPFPGGSLTARTMELGATLGSWEVTSYPHSVTPTGHGLMGVDLVADPKGPLAKEFPRITSEGINEHGFTVSAHTLEVSEYQEAGAGGKEDVSFLRVTLNLLRNAVDVPSAVAYLQSVNVVNKPSFAQKLTRGMHWGVSDAAGRSVVLEYLKGSLNVHNNSVGVMTNDPPFDWHLYNLNTHVNLQRTWPDANDDLQRATEIGAVPRVIGHGYNLAGLPGDASPPSRFTRLFFLREYAQRNDPPKSLEDAIVQGQGLLNNVFIIRGTVSGKSLAEGYEYVPFAVMKIPTRGIFMFRSYTDMQWREVDLNQVDFNSGSSIISMGLPRGINAFNVTEAFTPF